MSKQRRPRQAEREESGWSLAGVLVQMNLGNIPHSDLTPSERMHQILQHERVKLLRAWQRSAQRDGNDANLTRTIPDSGGHNDVWWVIIAHDETVTTPKAVRFVGFGDDGEPGFRPAYAKDFPAE